MAEPRLVVTTAVVNLKGRVHENGGQVPAGVVYIGGKVTQGGWKLAATKWANPWRPGRDGPLAEVLARYREYVLATPELRAALPELRGKVLGCWCAPKPCHGHVLAQLADTAEGREEGETMGETKTATLTPEQFDVVYDALEGEAIDDALEQPCGVTMEYEGHEIALAPMDLACENVTQTLERLVAEAMPLAPSIQRVRLGDYRVPHSTARGAGLVAVTERGDALRCADSGCADTPGLCAHVVAVWIRRAQQKVPPR